MSTARQYELVYIVTPDATEQEIADLHTQIEQIVQRFGGTFDKTENWGRKRLAYDIGHHREGNYVVETITGSGELMKEIDRRLRVIDPGHPAPRRPRGRGAAGGAADDRRAQDVRRAAPRGARAAARAAARRRARRRRLPGRHGRVWRSSDEGRTRRRRRGGGRDRTRKTARAARRRGAGSSAAAASASSARRRSTTSTTRTCGCWRRSCRSAARFSRAASRARARCTSASCRWRSSAPASWR